MFAHLELAHRQFVLNHPVGLTHRHPQVTPGGEIQHADQLRHINVLGGQPAAQHVVRVGHHLHPKAGEVGVRLASGQIQRLAGVKCGQVQHQSHQRAYVAWVTLRKRQERLGGIPDPLRRIPDMLGCGNDIGQ